MAEAALELIKTEPVEEKALSITDKAKMVKVTDAATYVSACQLWKDMGAMMKEIEDTFDPIIDINHKAWKTSLAKKAKFYDPLKEARAAVKTLTGDYDAEQTRLRKLEEARLLAIQKAEEEKARQIEIDRLKAEAKAEEDRLMEAALAAEQAGDKQTAEVLTAAAVNITEEVKQESAAILAAPIQAAVILPKSTPKVAGIVYTTRWSASVTDIKTLCLAIGTGRASTEFVIGLDRDRDTGIITSPSLNKQATSLNDKMCIPGVTAISKRC